VAIAPLLAALVVGCGGGGTAQQGSGDEPLEVVASFSILADMVRNVGGEEVEVTELVGPNSDAHTFEPSPRDSAELAEASVVFQNGLDFEPWLDELYESSESDAERVAVAEGVKPVPAAEGEHGHEHAEENQEEHADEHGDEHVHEHGEFDPHVWQDPNNAVVMVEAIRDALVEADGENARTYRQNAEEYLAELQELDAFARERVDSIPEENRLLFTSHDTLGYFAERYGFEVDTALASVSTEASDPSAGKVARLVEEIRSSGVPAIFAENVSNPDLMRRIADEAGVELAPPLYTDALGEPGSEGETYVEMMRYNARTISEALRG
jgi:ABC-type Zn uptake system ZnuABC Zn-binding protein ZnuA